MSPVAAPADRRFRRAHLKPSRRRARWRGLVRPVARYGLLALLCAFAIYRGTGLLASARLLQIDRIIVRGNQWLSNGEALALLGGMRGENLIWTDLDGWRRRLLTSPWVQDAALRRWLPSTVEVSISERQPVAIGRINGDLYLVDDRGIVIDVYGPRYGDFDLPIVDGLAAIPGSAGAMTDEPRADLATRVIAALAPDPEVATRLSQIDVSDSENAAVILSGDPAVIYVGRDRFLPRLQSYVQLASALRERVPDIDYVDLRFDDRIYVRPARAPRRGRAVAMAARSGPAGRAGRTGGADKTGW